MRRREKEVQEGGEAQVYSGAKVQGKKKNLGNSIP